ncbi:hypothetical protein [Paraeggerthella sp.]
MIKVYYSLVKNGKVGKSRTSLRSGEAACNRSWTPDEAAEDEEAAG